MEFSRKQYWSGLPCPPILLPGSKWMNKSSVATGGEKGGIWDSSVAQSCPTLRPHESQHARPPCPSPTPRVYSNSCPLSWWWHPTIFCHPLLLPSIFCSIRVFSKESALCIRWPKYWSFSFNISPSNEHPGPISLRMDWLDLLAVQGTLESLLKHHSPKASILRSAFFIVQLPHTYMTTGKTIPLTRRTFVGKVEGTPNFVLMKQ